jgi:hypothetical protein
MNRSADEIIRRLKEIGYSLADTIHEIYPDVIILALAYQPYQPRYQDSPGYLIDGILERAKEMKYHFKVVDGGEGTIWYTNLSLADLKQKIDTRAYKTAPYLEKYPSLRLGATIAPYEDIEKTCCWIKDWYEKNKGKIEVKTIQDFIPLFNLLFTTNEYVWIYGSGGAGPNGGYNEYDPAVARTYDAAIKKALAPSSPTGLKQIPE